MRVLIIGGTRFVGYLTAWRLLARGEQVTLLNRGTTPDPFGDRVERLRVDRTTPEFARALAERRFDATVDFAAYTGADARGVIDALGERAGHYLFISTGQVYLVREHCPRPARELDYHGPVMARPAGEADLPEWEYGIGKRDAEDTLDAAFHASGFQATRLRIPMVNGERDHYRRIETYLWRIYDGGPLLIPDGGGHLTRHVYGDDVARTIVGLLGRSDALGDAYNLAQEETPSLLGLLSLLREVTGARTPLVSVPAERLHQHGVPPAEISPFSGRWMSFLDPARARAHIGFRPTPLAESMARIVASFLASPPPAPPANYAHRSVELKLARRA